MQKNEAIAPIRQTVGLLAYLFPSLVPSRFDAEVPFTLEETAERLQKLSLVRVSKPASRLAYLLRMVASDGFDRYVHSRDTVVEKPIHVTFAPLDPDTLRCHVVLNDDRFRVVVRGYLKRWDRFSTVVNVRANFNPYYPGLLVKGVAYTFVAVIVSFGLLVSAPEALALLLPFTVPLAMMLFVLVMVVLWHTEVVFPAQTRRDRLMTRIEDILLLPLL